MAAAAYQSGDRLFCEYDQKTKHYRNKKEVVFSTILTVSVQLEKLYHERTDMAVRVFPFDRPRELVEMLWDYYDIRADERRSWSRYAQRECSLNALKNYLWQYVGCRSKSCIPLNPMKPPLSR